MKTFQAYLLDLQEMPFVNSYITRGMIDQQIENHDKFHLAAKSKSIGKNSFTYTSENGLIIYFRKNSKGLPEELNYINKDNIQVLAYKRNGSVSVIVDHMIYHIRKYGELKTDASQTPGAKHLWINFIRSNPRKINFEVRIESDLIELTKNNIDSYEDEIWMNSLKSSDRVVRAYVY